MIELERILYPRRRRRGRAPRDHLFRSLVAAELGGSLEADVPSLSPREIYPAALVTITANEAMPIIFLHYWPHAPYMHADDFLARVRLKKKTFGRKIRRSDSEFAIFLTWYSGVGRYLKSLTRNRRLDYGWWLSFVRWLMRAGRAWEELWDIRRRAALYETYFSAETSEGKVKFGRATSRYEVPDFVVHEAMHLFEHKEFGKQAERLTPRTKSDIFTEGFAEYLARGVRDKVVDAVQNRRPPPLKPKEEAWARRVRTYDDYYSQVVKMRDALYRHGQNGEEAIRLAFFEGEGWRFGLLESRAGRSSPIEAERPLPAPADVLFAKNGAEPLSTTPLDPAIAYLRSRSIATVEVIGRADPTGTDRFNRYLARQRARAVSKILRRASISARRIRIRSRGANDQIVGGDARNRRATVLVVDPRNIVPRPGGQSAERELPPAGYVFAPPIPLLTGSYRP